MFTVSLLSLIYIVITSNTIYVSADAQAVHSAQLLPDGFLAAFGDYEILSMRKDGEEDIVHVRKRAEDKDCQTDCMNYSGWTENGQMQCPSEELGEDVDSEDANIKRGLVKRGGPKVAQ